LNKFLEAIFRPAPIVVVREGKQLGELELNEILTTLPDTHPAWRAFNQLIDTAERNSIASAQAYLGDPTTAAGHLGGSKALSDLRSTLYARRVQGRIRNSAKMAPTRP
jgi:hypothetical protein